MSKALTVIFALSYGAITAWFDHSFLGPTFCACTLGFTAGILIAWSALA